MAELALAAIQVTPDGPVRALPSCSVVIDWNTLTGTEWGRIDGDFTGTLHQPTSSGSCATARSAGSSPAPTASPSTSGDPEGRSHPSSDERWPSVTTAAGTPAAHDPTAGPAPTTSSTGNDGGTTVLINLVSLCDHHHHVVHLPGWTATFDGHTLTVTRPDGTEVT